MMRPDDRSHSMMPGRSSAVMPALVPARSCSYMDHADPAVRFAFFSSALWSCNFSRMRMNKTPFLVALAGAMRFFSSAVFFLFCHYM
jgi:hypothetical protein